jgi:hypothetical protein
MRRGVAFVALLMPPLLLGCTEAATTNRTADPPSSDAPGFTGSLICPAGEDVGEAFWDYGANPRGETTDVVAWVRTHSRGLDAGLNLTFLPTAGDLRNVVIATGEDGVVLAFVVFGKDARGRFFPNGAEVCPSSGIEDFTAGRVE